MSELVVVTYPDLYRAGEVCAILQRLQREFLIDIEDAAYITKEPNGKLKLHQTMPIVAASHGTRRTDIAGHQALREVLPANFSCRVRS